MPYPTATGQNPYGYGQNPYGQPSQSGTSAVPTTVSATPQRVAIADMSGGLDLRRSPSLLAQNRSRLLRNWSLQEPGALVTYPGWSSFSTASLGNSRGQGGARIYLAALAFNLFGWNGGVYKPSDGGVPGSALVSSLSTTNEMYFPYDRDLVAVFDGSHIPKKSQDGTTWTQDGIDAPSTPPTATAVNAGGTLTDTSIYEFSYAYQDDALVYWGNESATVQVTMGAPNLTARVGVTASTDPQVETIILFARDVSAGEQFRKRTTTIPNATTTIDVKTNNWSTGDEAPTDHNVPPALSFGTVWKNRWWGVDATVGNRLRFTQIFLAQAWPSLFFIDIPFERGDSIAAIIPQGDTLVVCGQSKIFLIIGQTSLDFEVRPSLAVQEGALGPRCVEALENGVIHAGAGGVYLFDGASDRLLSYDIDPAWRDLIGGAAVADIRRIACTYHTPRKEVRFAVPRLYPFGTAGEWILDLNRTRVSGEPAWTSTDRPVGGYLSWNGNEAATGNRGRLFSWSNTIGKLYEEATGTSADGANMVCDYAGPVLATGYHTARFIDYYGEYMPATGSLTGEVLVNGQTQGARSIVISGNVTLYGSGTYGSAFYGGGRSRKKFVQALPLSAEGESVQFKFTYQGTSTFRHYGYAVNLVPEAHARGL